MPLFSFEGPQYDIDDVKIARNNGDGTFGTAVDVPSVDLYVANFRTKSAEGRGDGGITAVASQIEACEVTVRNLSIAMESLEVFLGISIQSSGVSPNRERSMHITNNRFPYFGIVGRAFAGESDAGTMIFFPYVKIMQNFEWRMEYNVFTMPEVRALALRDPVLLGEDGRRLLSHVKGYETMPEIEIPLP